MFKRNSAKRSAQERQDNMELLTKNKTVSKWLKRVRDRETPWTENEIIHFRKFIGRSGYGDEFTRMELCRMFSGPYDITAEQSAKGIDWLKRFAFKADGQPRQTKNMPFAERELNIIRNFHEFKFTGVYNTNQNYDFYIPVYQVIDKDGNSFEYTTNMGLIEVVG